MTNISGLRRLVFGLSVTDINVEIYHRYSAYQCRSFRPISDPSPRPISDPNSEPRFLHELYTYRPIDDPSWCLAKMVQRTPPRPISDGNSAHQTPNLRPISDPPIGLSVTLRIKSSKQDADFSPVFSPLTRAHDLNNKLTILTHYQTKPPAQKGALPPWRLKPTQPALPP